MSARRPRAVLAVCWTLFAVLAVVLARRDWLPFGFERAAVDWSVAHRPAGAETAAEWLTSLGTDVFPYLLALAAGACAARPYGYRTAAGVRWLLLPVGWLIAGQLLRQALMHGFGRPRPPASGWAFDASGFSFPSGHSFTSAVSAGLLALALAGSGRRAVRVGARVGAVLFAGAIGLSRVYLGVHWPLDVLGGWLLAAGWLALGVFLLGAPLRRPGGLQGK
ncbi:phosphatase PAP2 family protein [Kitasatospora sp. NPDC088134]|uniref:phosphatase PAP2 family protein n=1 Tax=Kitasatospora sp. NPDC088134 TaxID=3364071 RepID=UPI00382809C7